MTTDVKILISATEALADDGFTIGEKWRTCHDLCQLHEGQPSFDLVHGLVHLIEGDSPNARYWYQRSSIKQLSNDIKTEWRNVLNHLSTAGN